jgi:hypothetical protein
MEFPTDVLSLIHAYAKPLPRRTISAYWNDAEYDYPDLTNDVEWMTDQVINRFRDWIINKSDAEITYFNRTWWEQNLEILGWQDNRYTVLCPVPLLHSDNMIVENMIVELNFTMEELMKWNGELENDELFLEEDEDIRYQVNTVQTEMIWGEMVTTKWKTI